MFGFAYVGSAVNFPFLIKSHTLDFYNFVGNLLFNSICGLLCQHLLWNSATVGANYWTILSFRYTKIKIGFVSIVLFFHVNKAWDFLFGLFHVYIFNIFLFTYWSSRSTFSMKMSFFSYVWLCNLLLECLKRSNNIPQGQL